MYGLTTVVVGLVGCGGGHELETAPVKGTVLLDGQPVTSGYVTIAPSRGRLARGVIQEDGAFVMGTYSKSDGVQVGSHPVTVTPVPPDEGAGGRSRIDIPRRYGAASSSGLSIEVPSAGVDAHVIELTSE